MDTAMAVSIRARCEGAFRARLTIFVRIPPTTRNGDACALPQSGRVGKSMTRVLNPCESSMMSISAESRRGTQPTRSMRRGHRPRRERSAFQTIRSRAHLLYVWSRKIARTRRCRPDLPLARLMVWVAPSREHSCHRQILLRI